MNDPFVCPICREGDMNNTINGKKICIKCMHLLVPFSELTNYNRNYRRHWNTNKKIAHSLNGMPTTMNVGKKKPFMFKPGKPRT